MRLRLPKTFSGFFFPLLGLSTAAVAFVLVDTAAAAAAVMMAACRRWRSAAADCSPSESLVWHADTDDDDERSLLEAAATARAAAAYAALRLTSRPMPLMATMSSSSVGARNAVQLLAGTVFACDRIVCAVDCC